MVKRDPDKLLAQADRCRRLAANTFNQELRAKLAAMAEEYEQLAGKAPPAWANYGG